MNFVPCVKWIKRGVAKRNPEKVLLTAEELRKIAKSGKGGLEDVNEDEPMEQDVQPSSSVEVKYNMKDYDKETEADKSLFGIGGLIAEDDGGYQLEDDHDSDEEDDNIEPNDNLIVVGNVKLDMNLLKIFVYNYEEGYHYVHHDIILESVPLCLEWLNHDPTDSNRGNLIAVGGMSAVISVWDLDIMNCAEPAFLLGKYSLKKKRNKGYGHKDAVLDIAWNSSYTHILASGSVDKTVILWDLDNGKPSTTFDNFTEKVQCIKWRPNNYHSLLTGSSDNTAKLFDCRMMETEKTWLFNEEIEKVAWCPWDDNKMYFGTSEGNLMHYDLRQNEKSVWEVEAHGKAITGLELDEKCGNLLFTSSEDEMVKVWNIENDQVKIRSTRAFNMDELHCLDLNPDCPYIACVGGTKKGNNFQIVNLEPKAANEIKTNAGPVLLAESHNSKLQNTEHAFKSLSIKNKKIQSKKKYGHRYKS